MTGRPRCGRCRRPGPLCYCAGLVPLATATRVVFLQHPRERTAAMGTARLAHLALANSELHVGVRFADVPRLRALADDDAAALLYPDGGAPPAPATRPRVLVVLDGTWTTARKMLARNPWLARLPRIRLAPATPSTYRIRREPAPHCLSTVEAVAAALTALEGGGARFTPMLAAFERLVAVQVRCAGAARVPYRHTRKRARRGGRPTLAERLRRAVVVQAEGNPAGRGGGHELVVLAAARVATGETFAATIAPRQPLHPRLPGHLDLAAERLTAGEPLAEVRARWARFAGPDDLFAGWGTFTPRLLGAEGIALAPWIDLRPHATQKLGRRTGGAERAGRLLGTVPAPREELGRAGRRLVALRAIVGYLGDIPHA